MKGGWTFREKVALIYSAHTARSRLWHPMLDALETFGRSLLNAGVAPIIILALLWKRIISGPIRDIFRPHSQKTIESLRADRAKRRERTKL